MKTIKRNIKVEKSWLLDVLNIEEDEKRDALFYACMGRATNDPHYKDVEGFVWPEIQAIWEKTRIIPVTYVSDGYIEYKEYEIQ